MHPTTSQDNYPTAVDRERRLLGGPVRSHLLGFFLVSANLATNREVIGPSRPYFGPT
jgi:hypothetical protein